MTEAIEVYRICKTKRADTAFDGEGAFRFGGRWNSPGTRMIYAAGSLALAALEMLVHLDDDSMLLEYSYIPSEIPADSVLEIKDFYSLPSYWNMSPAALDMQQIGDKWIREKMSAVLEVPTSVIPLEKYYLLNPDHKEFNKIVIGEIHSFTFDETFRNS